MTEVNEVNEVNKYFITRYINKNGEEKVYKHLKEKYNIKKYNKQSYENRKNMLLNTYYICECCNCKVVICNKNKHLKTQKHKLLTNIKN